MTPKIYITGLILHLLVISTLGFKNDEEAEEFLNKYYEPASSKMCTKQVTAQWNFATDVDNKTKEEAQLNATLEGASFDQEYWQKYFRDVDPNDFSKEIIRRQLTRLVILGNAALDPAKLTEFTHTVNTMTNIYSTAKICPYNKQNCNLKTEGLSLEPDIEAIIASSANYQELSYVWSAWRNQSGAKMKEHYKNYVSLSNEAAVANNFKDKGEMWISDYESPNFIEDMNKLWDQVKPLYDELHKYVAQKLKLRFGDEIDVSDGLIPAHVLGNMWAQKWTNLDTLVVPFPNVTQVDVTGALKEQNYTVLKMFETSDDFYKSLGLEPNDICYNVEKGAMIEKPSDREVLCHASAWDFCDGENYRVKMCTSINYKDFITIHHEMGHIQYFLLYKNQPISLRTGANPGFHEAVGDTIALSVATPKHLQKVGLLKNYTNSYETDINQLMNMALERVAFLPFGLLIDKWRWDVFAGKVTPKNWNSHWWHYRETIQKIKPPTARSDDIDFDPAAKFHIPGDSQYINYFFAHILEFQLYKALCIASGEYDPNNKDVPLHTCDFYQSKIAGDKLRAGLSLGQSKHWKVALKEITGEDNLDASALLEYFKPLMDYLVAQNKNIK